MLQHEHLGRMSFRQFMEMPILHGLLQTVDETYDPEHYPFVTRVSGFIVSLEDVVRLTGLRFHGVPVMGFMFAVVYAP